MFFKVVERFNKTAGQYSYPLLFLRPFSIILSNNEVLPVLPFHCLIGSAFPALVTINCSASSAMQTHVIQGVCRILPVRQFSSPLVLGLNILFLYIIPSRVVDLWNEPFSFCRVYPWLSCPPSPVPVHHKTLKSVCEPFFQKVGHQKQTIPRLSGSFQGNNKNGIGTSLGFMFENFFQAQLNYLTPGKE